MQCILCGASVSFDEAGLNKKLLGRDTKSFLCLTCLAKRFGVTQERLQEKIEEYRRMGCLLFTSKPDDD